MIVPVRATCTHRRARFDSDVVFFDLRWCASCGSIPQDHTFQLYYSPGLALVRSMWIGFIPYHFTGVCLKSYALKDVPND